jgi:signal peptidase I
MTRIRRVLWLAAGGLLVVVIFQAYVGGIYPVASSSMAPTLLPGDQVLVLYNAAIPARGEVVVVHGVEPNPLVKRVAALPGEELAITPDGDLLVNRRYLPRDSRVFPPVLILDTQRSSFEQHFTWPESAPASEGSSQMIVLNGLVAHRPGQQATLLLRNGVHDGYLDASGEVHFGEQAVGDARVSVRLELLDERGQLLIRLSDQGDVFEVRLDWRGRAASQGTLSRLTIKGDAFETRESEPFQLELSSDLICLTLDNFDNEVRLMIDGRLVTSFSYSKASRQSADPIEHRLSLGILGARLQVDRLRIWRDLHYTSRGRFGVDHAVRLEPDEFFLLGDNSDHSTDSREYGPVKVERLIGRAAWIVWPPSRMGRVVLHPEAAGEACEP